MGCKIGALPFIHASKDRIATWVRDKILEIDTKNLEHDKSTRINKEDQLADPQLALDFAGAQFPTWVTSINSSQTLDKVRRYIPWAAGSSTAHAYSSGQESYWLLCTNPYTVQALPKRHSPETMLGIWCHTRGTHSFISSFHHKMRLKEAFSGYHEITGSASTFEAIVVQYADDITWAIENMNDANAAALLNGQHSLYNEFSKSLENNIGAEQVPLVLATAITRYDAGGIYGFFIDDFIRYSGNILNQLAKQNGNRSALAGGNSLIGLSDIGERHLQEMIGFLEKFVFQEPRVKNRKEMLGVVSRACVDLLYQGEKEALVRRIDERGTVERWDRDQIDEAKKALDDPIHRVQLSIDVFAEMGDHEIYDYVGIETL